MDRYSYLKDLTSYLNEQTPNLNFNNILKEATISSTSTFINWLKYQLELSQYEIVSEDKDEEEFIFLKSGSYYLANIKNTVNSQKQIHFQHNATQNIQEWIGTLKIMNEKEYKVHRELNAHKSLS